MIALWSNRSSFYFIHCFKTIFTRLPNSHLLLSWFYSIINTDTNTYHIFCHLTLSHFQILLTYYLVLPHLFHLTFHVPVWKDEGIRWGQTCTKLQGNSMCVWSFQTAQEHRGTTQNTKFRVDRTIGNGTNSICKIWPAHTYNHPSLYTSACA